MIKNNMSIYFDFAFIFQQRGFNKIYFISYWGMEMMREGKWEWERVQDSRSKVVKVG